MVNGKLETDSGTAHVCKQQQQKEFVPPRPQMRDTPQPPIQSASDKLIENLTKAVEELAYTINTLVVSSLVSEETERQMVRDRVARQEKE